MPRLAFTVGLNRLDPAAEDTRDWLAAHRGKDVIAEVRVPRNPQYARFFWATAGETFKNLPEPYSSYGWKDSHAMVKGIQEVYPGLCEGIIKPLPGGKCETIYHAKSLAFENMDEDEFRAVTDIMFPAFAHMLGVHVLEIIEEGRRAS